LEAAKQSFEVPHPAPHPLRQLHSITSSTRKEHRTGGVNQPAEVTRAR
jgi:hypothetical protein